jgi:ATP-dependent Clp protease protease subunit
MAIEKTELTDNLAYGVDLKNRRIYFGINLDSGDVDESTGFNLSSVEYAVRAMHRMATEAPGKPIELHMCSYGGSIHAMYRLIDEILACPCQIKFFGGGTIMSAAVWVMVVCDERYLHTNTTVMVHELSDEFDRQRQTDLRIIASENDRLMNRLTKLFADNTRMPQEFWQDVCQRDLHLTAEEAIKLGLADKLIEPKKRGNLRKMRQAALKKEPEQKEMKDMLSSIYSRINKIKVPKIEFNEVKKEPVDPHVIVDTTPVPQIEKPQELPVAIEKSGEVKS